MTAYRFLGAGLAGGAVTVALIVMMSGLISSDPVVAGVEPESAGITFGDSEIDETPERKVRPKKPDEPKPQELPKRPANSPGVDSPIATEATSPEFTELDTGNLMTGIRGPGGPGFDGRGELASDSGALPVSRFQPQYPRQAALNKQEGYVVVAFTIAVDGSVVDASVVESSPPRVFDRAALNSIMRWKFKPKTVDGRPVRQEAVQRLDFKLPD